MLLHLYSFVPALTEPHFSERTLNRTSAPSLSGLARGLAEVRHALEVLVSVSMQTEQALRAASGRLESVRSGATWAASFTLVAVGLWIARRGPRTTQKMTEVKEEAR